MGKLSMCRICLVEDVRMYVVSDKHLQELYEKLTDVPFATEDRKPMLTCFLCLAKLKQCSNLQRKCLQAEELFAQLLKDEYKPNPLIDQELLEYSFGYTPIEHISIDPEFQIETYVIKEELPAVSETPDNIIKSEEEDQTDELKLECQDTEYLECFTNQKEMSPHHSESEYIPLHHFESEDMTSHYLPSMVLTEVKVEELPEREPAAKETGSSPVARKTKLNERRIKVEDITTVDTVKQDKNQLSSSKNIRTVPNSLSKSSTKHKEPVIITKPRVNKNNIYKSKGNNRQVKKPLTTTTSLLQNNKNELFKCDICQRSFSFKGNLTRHINIHTGEKPYTCDICQRSFNRKGYLIKHIRAHTTGTNKPYKCDICQRSLSDKCALTKHIRIHTGEKPYKCDICQRSFNCKGNLKEHIRIVHTRIQFYECGICSRSFSTKTNFTRHNRVHTGEKPYKCDTCQRCFSGKKDLTNHNRIHTGEKPYKCDILSA